MPFKDYMRMFAGQFKRQAKRVPWESVVCCGAAFVESSSTCVTTEMWNCTMKKDKVSHHPLKDQMHTEKLGMERWLRNQNCSKSIHKNDLDLFPHTHMIAHNYM